MKMWCQFQIQLHHSTFKCIVTVMDGHSSYL